MVGLGYSDGHFSKGLQFIESTEGNLKRKCGYKYDKMIALTVDLCFRILSFGYIQTD